jgi:hypothetical protein
MLEAGDVLIFLDELYTYSTLQYMNIVMNFNMYTN